MMNPIKKISETSPTPIVWNDTCDLVYVRNNIVLHTTPTESYYTYDEYKYTSREFSSLYFEQLRADLDYLSMMAEVDL